MPKSVNLTYPRLAQMFFGSIPLGLAQAVVQNVRGLDVSVEQTPENPEAGY